MIFVIGENVVADLEKDGGMGYNRRMKKKKQVFTYKYPTSTYVLMGVMMVCTLAFAVLNVCKLAAVGNLYSALPGLDIVSVIIGVGVCTVLVLTLCLTRYVVTDDALVYQRIKPTRIEADRLLLIRHELSEDMVVLYIADDAAPDGVRYLVIRVAEDQVAPFVRAIQAINPRVGYDLFNRKESEENNG